MSRAKATQLSALMAGALSKMSGPEQQMLRQQIRLLSTTHAKLFPKEGPVHPGYAKLKAKMEKFQVDDGVPVHLKGGKGDIILYYITIAVATVGLAGCFELYYSLAWPKKPQ